MAIWVECRDDVTGDGGQRLTVGDLGERGAVVGGELAVEAGEARSDGTEHVLVVVAEGDKLKQLFQTDVPLAFERLRLLHLFRLKADGVDDDEMVFVAAVRSDILKLRWSDDARAAALHLLKHGAALNGAHEEDDLEWANVGTYASGQQSFRNSSVVPRLSSDDL